MTERDKELAEAIEAWWSRAAESADDAGILRSWYVIAEGVGADDGGSNTQSLQQFDADIMQQLGLARYMQKSVERRMWRAES